MASSDGARAQGQQHPAARGEQRSASGAGSGPRKESPQGPPPSTGPAGGSAAAARVSGPAPTVPSAAVWGGWSASAALTEVLKPPAVSLRDILREELSAQATEQQRLQRQQQAPPKRAEQVVAAPQAPPQRPAQGAPQRAAPSGAKAGAKAGSSQPPDQQASKAKANGQQGPVGSAAAKGKGPPAGGASVASSAQAVVSKGAPTAAPSAARGPQASVTTVQAANGAPASFSWTDVLRRPPAPPPSAVTPEARGASSSTGGAVAAAGAASTSASSKAAASPQGSKGDPEPAWGLPEWLAWQGRRSTPDATGKLRCLACAKTFVGRRPLEQHLAGADRIVTVCLYCGPGRFASCPLGSAAAATVGTKHVRECACLLMPPFRIFKRLRVGSRFSAAAHGGLNSADQAAVDAAIARAKSKSTDMTKTKHRPMLLSDLLVRIADPGRIARAQLGAGRKATGGWSDENAGTSDFRTRQQWQGRRGGASGPERGGIVRTTRHLSV